MEELILWISNNLDQVEPLNPMHFHLEDVEWQRMSFEEIFYTCSSILVEVVESSILDLVKLSTLITIPLKCSDKLMTSIPEADLIGEEIDDEPPAIYLYDRESRRRYERGEECRISIHSLSFTYEVYRFEVYYRCFRNHKALTQNWEYSRCIYMEAFPIDMVGPF